MIIVLSLEKLGLVDRVFTAKQIMKTMMGEENLGETVTLDKAR